MKLDADFGGKLLEDIFPGGDEFGSLLDESVGRPCEFVGDVSGNGEDFPALLKGATGGDAGATEFAGLHDQDATGKSADNAVAQREIVGRG